MLGRDQADIVTQRVERACPVMRTGTGLDTNRGWRMSAKKRHHLSTREFAFEHLVPPLVHAHGVEAVLGDIETNGRCAIFHGGLPLLVQPVACSTRLAHCDAV